MNMNMNMGQFGKYKETDVDHVDSKETVGLKT